VAEVIETATSSLQSFRPGGAVTPARARNILYEITDPKITSHRVVANFKMSLRADWQEPVPRKGAAQTETSHAKRRGL
jgi:hypothetical protein